MNAGDEGHASDGAEGATGSQELRFLRSKDFSGIKSRSDDLPVFLAAPQPLVEPLQKYPSQGVRGQTRGALFSDISIASGTKSWVAWKDWLDHSSSSLLRWRPLDVSEEVARIALIVVLAPLPIALSPDRVPRLVETAPPVFSIEDRLAFARGLGDRLMFEAPVLALERPVDTTKRARDVAPAKVEVEEQKQRPTLTEFDAGGRESSPIETDERRWSLPFESTDYTIEDLPTTPERAFRTGITISVITNAQPSVTAENDSPPMRVQRPNRRVEKRKRTPIKVRVVRLESLPPAVQAAILQQRQAANPSPFPFFLGAPPPKAPAENAPPKKSFSFPESVHDTFKSEY